MSFSFLSPFPDPFFKILELEIPSDIHEHVLNQDLKTIFSVNIFPEIERSVIKAAQMRYKETFNYTTAIQWTKFYFPFYPESLEKLIEIEDKLTAKEKSYCTIFILFSYNTWVTLFEKTKKIEFFPILLNAIWLYLDSSNTDLLTCALMNLLSIYIKAHDFSKFREIFPTIRKIFLCCKKLPPETLYVFPEIITNLIPENSTVLPDTILEVLAFFYQKSIKINSQCSVDAAMQIMEIIEDQFLAFDHSAMMYYSHISYTFTNEFAQYFSKVSVDSIINEVKKGQIKTNYPIIEEPNYEKTKWTRTVIHVEFLFPKIKSYVNGFSASSSDIFSTEETKNLEFDEKFCENVKLIVKGVCAKQELIGQFLENIIQKLSDEKENISIPIIAFICNEILLLTNNEAILQPLTHLLPIEKIFTPLIVCTKENCKQETFLFVNKIRNTIVNLFMAAGIDEFDRLLGDLLSYPMIFAETFYRLLLHKEEMIPILSSDPLISKSFSDYLMNLKVMNEKGVENAEFARTAVFHVLSKFFQSTDIQHHFFSNSYFTSCFLSFMFEANLTNFIISQCMLFLSKCSLRSSELPDNISKITGFLSISFPDKDCLKLATKIAKLLYNCFVTQAENAVQFKSVIRTFRESFLSLDNSEESRAYFLACIELFVVSLSDNPMKRDDLDSFEEGISKVFSSENYSVLSEKLIMYMAGDISAKFEKNIIIREPYVLFLLFKLYEQIGKLIDICNYAERLCKFSQTNCIACHKCEFDLFIVNKIIDFWPHKDKPEIQALLPLFTTIAQVISSAAVVQRYISLICPIKHYLSPNFTIALDELITLFHVTYKEPTEITELSDAQPFFQQAISMSGNITFTFWLKIEQITSNYFPILLSIPEQGNMPKIEIYVNGRSITVQQGELKTTTSERLIEKKWNFIALTFFGKTLEVFIDGSDAETVAIHILNETTNFLFGGLTNDSEKPQKPYSLSPFGAFQDIKKSELLELKDNGYIEMRKITAGTFFLFKTSKTKQSQQRQNFISVLTTKCKIDMILPIFKFASYKFEDGSTCSDLLSKALEILINALIWSVEVETSFYESKGFAIISYLLKKGDHSLLTYELYEKFYSMLSILLHKPLKQQLIDEILLDIDLWYRADGQQQLQIFSHWTMKLFTTHKTYVMKSISFSSLLMQLLIYFRESNNDSISHIPSIALYEQKGDIKVTDIRTIFIQALTWISLQENAFNVEDYTLILSICLTSQDNKFVNELVQLIDQMVLSQPSPFNSLNQKGVNLVIPLLPLFQKENEEIHISTIDTILDMYKYNVVTDPPLSVQVNVLIRKIPTNLITEGFINHLIQRITDCYELVPLLSWCLSFSKAIDSLKPLQQAKLTKVKKEEYAAVWPFILFKCQSTQISLNVIRSVIINDPKNVINSYNAVEIMCKALGISAQKMKKLFIQELTNIISDNQIEIYASTLKQYIEIVQSFFFLNRKGPCSKELLKLFKDSPFKESVSDFNYYDDDDEEDEKMKNFKTADEMMEALSEVRLIKSDMRFGLNLSKNWKWEDTNLASNCLNIIESFTPKQIPLILVFSFYLIKVIKNFKIKVSEKDSTASKDIEALLKFVESREKMQVVDEASINAMQQQVRNITLTAAIRYNDSLNALKEFIKQCNEVSLKSLSVFSSEHLMVWKPIQKKTLNTAKMRETTLTKQWRYMWSTLTIEGGPWENTGTKTLHVKRDNTLCFAYCPCKVKRNWNFQNHKAASIARDKGENGEEAFKKPEHIPEEKDEEDKTIKEKPILTSSCTVVTVKSEKKGEIHLLSHEIFISFENHSIRKYKYQELSLLIPQQYLHFNVSFEFFTRSGDSCFVVVTTEELAKSFMKVIDSKMTHEAQLESSRQTSTQMLEDWKARKISNFEYIINVNMRGSRTFNSPSQYPIFPWVINNFSCETIDLKDDKFYRDFGTPVGAFSDERLQMILAMYQELASMDPPGHMYSCGPMCSLVVYMHMIRLEPFTTLHIDMQSGRFDCSHRIFASMPNLFNAVCNDSNDYRELNPEFYFLPDFLLNKDGFDLGIDDEYPGGNVELPPWAENALDFVYIMRKALESEYTSRHLNEWFDLIFGYKQKGEEAIKAHNLYNADLYDDSWTPEILKDPKKRAHIEASKSFLGQMPKQIFSSPHEKREEISKLGEQVYFETGITPVSVLFDTETRTIYFLEKTLSTNYQVIGVSINQDMTKELEYSKKVLQLPSTSSVEFESFEKFNKTSLLAESSTLQIINLKTGTISSVAKNIQCAGGSDRYLVTVDNDNILYFYEASELKQPFRKAPFYRETAKCCFVSEQFHVAVIASRDKSVVIHSLERAYNVMSINIGTFIPRTVLVTKAWGFIATVVTKQKASSGQSTSILLHTINGDKIRERETPIDVVHITTFSSRSGFDYLLFSNGGNLLYFCEAYYLNFTEIKIKKPSFKISFIDYDNESRSIIIVSKVGDVLIKPFDPDLI